MPLCQAINKNGTLCRYNVHKDCVFVCGRHKEFEDAFKAKFKSPPIPEAERRQFFADHYKKEEAARGRKGPIAVTVAQGGGGAPPADGGGGRGWGGGLERLAGVFTIVSALVTWCIFLPFGFDYFSYATAADHTTDTLSTAFVVAIAVLIIVLISFLTLIVERTARRRAERAHNQRLESLTAHTKHLNQELEQVAGKLGAGAQPPLPHSAGRFDLLKDGFNVWIRRLDQEGLRRKRRRLRYLIRRAARETLETNQRISSDANCLAGAESNLRNRTYFNVLSYFYEEEKLPITAGCILLAGALFVLVLPQNPIRAKRWCSPASTGRAVTHPDRSIGRRRGVSFVSARWVRSSL